MLNWDFPSQSQPVQESLVEYLDLKNNEYRYWTHCQHISKWRRYRSCRKVAKFRFGGFEFLVVKLKAQDESGTVFLRFEQYIRDRCIDYAKGRNYHALAVGYGKLGYECWMGGLMRVSIRSARVRFFDGRSIRCYCWKKTSTLLNL